MITNNPYRYLNDIFIRRHSFIFNENIIKNTSIKYLINNFAKLYPSLLSTKDIKHRHHKLLRLCSLIVIGVFWNMIFIAKVKVFFLYLNVMSYLMKILLKILA